MEENYYLPSLLDDKSYEFITPIFQKSIAYNREDRFDQISDFIKAFEKLIRKFK